MADILTRFHGYTHRSPTGLRDWLKTEVRNRNLSEFFIDNRLPQVVGLLPKPTVIQDASEIIGLLPVISVWQNTKNPDPKWNSPHDAGRWRNNRIKLDSSVTIGQSFLDTIVNRPEKVLGSRERWIVISDKQLEIIKNKIDSVGGDLNAKIYRTYKRESIRIQVWENTDEESANLLGDAVLNMLEDFFQETIGRYHDPNITGEYGGTNFSYGFPLVGVDFNVQFTQMYWRIHVLDEAAPSITPPFEEVFGSATLTDTWGDSIFTAPHSTPNSDNPEKQPG